MPDASTTDLITPTDRGLYCPPGRFYIDPWKPVEHAVITHAHSDHARPGHQHYLTSTRGLGVARQRLGKDADIEAIDYGTPRPLHDVTVSLHPAGHLLGSSQIRVEHRGEVWVVTGDYKLEPDRTCATFEHVRCHTFITESTFGLPIYRWRPTDEIFADIHQWWRQNQEDGRTSLLMAYALGKAQRLLAGLDDNVGPILVHGAVANLMPPYHDAGIAFPHYEKATAENSKQHKGQAIVIAPPSAHATPWMRKFGAVSAAFVSGWMHIRGTRRRRAVDRGFPLSDHCDWPGLMTAIKESHATRIGVTHGYVTPVTRYLREQGHDAFIVPTHFEGEGEDPAA